MVIDREMAISRCNVLQTSWVEKNKSALRGDFIASEKKERKERNVDVKENAGWMGPCTVMGEKCMA